MKLFCLTHRASKIRNIVQVATLFIVVAPFLCFASEEKGSYGYKQVDVNASRKKFVVRLEADSKKIDFAIENTKSLIDRSRTRPYLPELYIRLAELYIEKSRVIYFLRNAEKSKDEPALKHAESDSLKFEAVEIYQNILSHFPKFQERDKVHFFMAHEYRELKQMEDMVAQYKAVVNEYPKSQYAAESALLLGDYFFSVKKFDASKKYYRLVFNYRGSPVIALARYKLGWIEINKGDYQKAISLFEESVTSASAGGKLNVDTYKQMNVKLESLIDMAYAYTEVNKESSPEDAISYFREYSWSRPVFTSVLEKLANRYFLKKKWENAAVLYRYISTLQEDPDKLLEYAKNIFEASRSLDTFEDADKDIAIMVKALEKQRYSIHIDDAIRQKNVDEYELYARDIVTHLHKKAKARAVVSDFEKAAVAYKGYLSFFTESPVFHDMENNYADALFFAKDFFEAGKIYERLAKTETIANKDREEKLYSAVVSYYNALKEKEGLSYFRTAFVREGLKDSGKLFTAEFPGSTRVPNVLFNVAWVNYESGNYDVAMAELKDFVKRYPQGDEAKAAVHLVLDIYRIREDYEGLSKYGHLVEADRQLTDDLFKRDVSEIVAAAEGKIINKLTISALKDEDRGQGRIDSFVKKYKSTPLGEQALLALMGPSRSKGNFDTVFTIGKQLIDDYPDSPKIEDTLGVLIESSIKATQFRLLANYLEVFAERLPNHSNTPEFLYKAARIRETLAEYTKVNKNYEILLRNPNFKDPDRQTEIIFALAESAKKSGDLDYEYKLLVDTKPYLTAQERVKADALIADYYFQKRMLRTAKEYTKKVRSDFNSKSERRDESLKPLVAKLAYFSLETQFKEYMKVKMGKKVEKEVVKSKSKMLKNLEDGYLGVLKYQSPEWTLMACYKSFEINDEFANFIAGSPVASYMSGDMKEKYMRVVAKKADSFRKKGEKYQQTCAEQFHRWEMTDPKLVKYYFSPENQSILSKQFDYFSEKIAESKISEDFLKSEKLKDLHGKLLKEPGDLKTLFTLALAYAGGSDYRQAVLIAKKAVNKSGKGNVEYKASAYNALGVFYLYLRDDIRARDYFKKSLEISPDSIAPMVNLAALFKYYGHSEKSDAIYRMFSGGEVLDSKESLIHPKAMEFYHSRNKLAQNG